MSINSHRLCCFGVFVLTMLFCATWAMPAGAQDAIKLLPQPDSKLVFVSPQGDDNHPGTSPDQAVKSLARGFALLRDGQPDWLLLERGHDYELATDTQLPRGQSKTAPAVIAAFGKGDAPTLDVGPNHARFGIEQQVRSNVKVHGVRFLGTNPELSANRLELDEQGWTILEPSEDSRVIYVSSSVGDDSNNGLSESRPVKTVARAHALARDGFPDWVLFKAGDVWHSALGGGASVPEWQKFGRSASEPLVISSYGEGDRPKFIARDTFWMSGSRSHFVLKGLHFVAETPGKGHGLRFHGKGQNILIEDCVYRDFDDNILLLGWVPGSINNFRIRRCLILDAHGGRSGGIYAYRTDGLLLEENLIDHNGWKPGTAFVPTLFNHNVYTKNATRTTMRGNIFSRGSSFGATAHLDADSGTLEDWMVEDNLFVGNANGITFSLNKEDAKYIRNTTVRNNVFTEMGRTIQGAGQASGIDMGPMSNALIANNLFIHSPYTAAHRPTTFAIRASPLTTGAVLRRNISYGWKGADIMDLTRGAIELAREGNLVNTDESAFVDAGKSVTSYWQSLGGAGDWERFLDQARQRGPGEWDPAMTARSVNRFLFEGFSTVGQ